MTMAVELVVNWARAHGYSYHLFDPLRYRFHVSAALPRGIRLDGTASKGALFWAKPRAILQLLERGPTSCPWVLYLDLDAVVNSVDETVEHALYDRFIARTPAVHVLFACHSPFGDQGDCLPCRCCRANRCPPAERARMPASDGSWLNAGALFVRNDEAGMARRMLQWWASGGDGGGCDAGVPATSSPYSSAHATARTSASDRHSGRRNDGLLHEQMCAQRMQRRWPEHVDVLNAATFNAPLWYDPKHFGWFDSARHTHASVLAQVVANQSRDGVRSLACLASRLFVCHAYDAPPATREYLLGRKLNASVARLTELLSKRGERYLVGPTLNDDSASPSPSLAAGSSLASPVPAEPARGTDSSPLMMHASQSVMMHASQGTHSSPWSARGIHPALTPAANRSGSVRVAVLYTGRFLGTATAEWVDNHLRHLIVPHDATVIFAITSANWCDASDAARAAVERGDTAAAQTALAAQVRPSPRISPPSTTFHDPSTTFHDLLRPSGAAHLWRLASAARALAAARRGRQGRRRASGTDGSRARRPAPRRRLWRAGRPCGYVRADDDAALAMAILLGL